VWSRERRREREAYYRSETLRKIAETQGAGGNSAIEFLREDEGRKAIESSTFSDGHSNPCGVPQFT